MTAPESFAGNTQGDPDWEVYMHTADAGLEVRVPVKAGTREVGVSFVRKHWEPEGVLQPPQRGFARTTNELYYGDPAVDSGPRRRSVPGRPARATRRAAARSSSAGRRATRVRGAVREADSLDARAPRLSPAGHRRGSCRRCSTSTRRAGPRAASTRAFSAVSGASWPRRAFLFRVEREPAQHRRRARRIGSTTIDLASRLSFFLWSSIPDDELLDAGGARDARQIRRCSSSRSGGCCAIRGRRRSSTISPTSGSSSGKLAGVVPDVDEFPDFDENLREAMQQETQLFVASQLREDRSVDGPARRRTTRS